MQFGLIVKLANYKKLVGKLDFEFFIIYIYQILCNDMNQFSMSNISLVPLYWFYFVPHKEVKTKRHLTYLYFLITHPPSNVKKVSEKNLVDRHPFLGMAAQIQPRLGRKGWT